MTGQRIWQWTRTALLVMLAAALMMSACAPGPLRLHVIANSDAETDQQVKMEVRDAVLNVTKDGILQCENAQEAKEYIEENLEIIVATANDTLEKNGFNYTAQAKVGISHFPDREYQGVRYPEGDYEALRVVLGDGKGKNWWCVMFPPLCISELESEGDETQYTSFFAEVFDKWFK